MSGVASLKAQFEQRDKEAQASSSPAATPKFGAKKKKKSWGSSSPRAAPSSPIKKAAKRPPPPPKVKGPTSPKSPPKSPKSPPKLRAPPTPTSPPAMTELTLQPVNTNSVVGGDSEGEYETPTSSKKSGGFSLKRFKKTSDSTNGRTDTKQSSVTSTTTSTSTTSGSKWSKKSSNYTGGSVSDADGVYSAKLANKNAVHLGYCKFIVCFLFFLCVFLYGVFGMNKCKQILVITDFFQDSRVGQANCELLDEYIPLVESGYDQAYNLCLFGVLGMIASVCIYMFLLYNIGILEYKYYVHCNYIVTHFVTFPGLMVFCMLFGVFNFMYFDGYTAGDKAWDYYLDIKYGVLTSSDNNCHEITAEILSDYAGVFDYEGFYRASLVNLVGVMFGLGALIGPILCCCYCSTTRWLFDGYQEYGMDCLIYFRCCLNCGRESCRCCGKAPDGYGTKN